jgi:O-acetyl-ADP-ribose deacetylase (regulator of RNase III)
MGITTIRWGSLLDSGADLLVCPVNCCPGVMGGGLAKAFADRWSGLAGAQAAAINQGGLSPGGGFMVYLTDGKPVSDRPATRPVGVYLIATKNHWRHPSRPEWVATGLDALGAFLRRDADYTARWQAHFDETSGTTPPGAIRSVAIPALGCGLGGLAWDRVEPLIRATAERFPGLDWLIYPPRA